MMGGISMVVRVGETLDVVKTEGVVETVGVVRTVVTVRVAARVRVATEPVSTDTVEERGTVLIRPSTTNCCPARTRTDLTAGVGISWRITG
jgi:hypothetical protein